MRTSIEKEIVTLVPLYKCDICGATGEPDGEENPPVGWSVIKIVTNDRGIREGQVLDVCGSTDPSCGKRALILLASKYRWFR